MVEKGDPDSLYDELEREYEVKRFYKVFADDTNRSAMFSLMSPPGEIDDRNQA